MTFFRQQLSFFPTPRIKRAATLWIPRAQLSILLAIPRFILSVGCGSFNFFAIPVLEMRTLFDKRAHLGHKPLLCNINPQSPTSLPIHSLLPIQLNFALNSNRQIYNHVCPSVSFMKRFRVWTECGFERKANKWNTCMSYIFPIFYFLWYYLLIRLQLQLLLYVHICSMHP